MAERNWNNQVETVLTSINKIPGTKIVTLMSPNSLNPTMTIDVADDGTWGYEPAYLALFTAKLASAINSEYGTILIRQFLPTMCDDTIPNKKLYGMLFNKGEMRVLPPEYLAEACEYDNTTGEYIGKEDGVFYADMAEFLGTEGA